MCVLSQFVTGYCSLENALYSRREGLELCGCWKTLNPGVYAQASTYNGILLIGELLNNMAPKEVVITEPVEVT